MENEFIHIDLFDKYYKKELNELAQNQFTQRLQEDKAFAEEYKLYQSMIIALKARRREKLRSKLNNIEAQLEEEGLFKEVVNIPTSVPVNPKTLKDKKHVPITKRKNSWWGVAASLALLLGAIGLINTIWPMHSFN